MQQRRRHGTFRACAHRGGLSSILLAVALVGVTPTHALRRTTDVADYVAWATVPAKGSVGYVLACQAAEGAKIFDDVIATREEYPSRDSDDSGLRIWYRPVDSDGRMLEVANHEIVWQERRDQGDPGYAWFRHYSALSGLGPNSPYTAQWAWAIWGGGALVHLDGER